MRTFLFLLTLWGGYALTLSAQCTVSFSAESIPLNPLGLTFSPWVLDASGLPANDYAVWWDFGDGNTSTDLYPTHTYYCAGFYTTCLIATLTDGCTTTDCHELTVGTLIGATCAAGFGVSMLESDDVGNTLSFADQSIVSEPILTYWWDFGDSTSSNETAPVHWFGNGTHQVCLTIMSGIPGTTSFCIDQHCEYITVGETPPVVATPIAELIVEPFGMAVQPNPMFQIGVLRLQCPIAYNNLTLAIYNSNGTEVWSQSSSYAAGTHIVEILPYRWRTGLYTARATYNSSVLAAVKFIKQ